MRHASLFSGIGGFDLAAEWMGWENVLQCEIDPFCQKVLRHHFPTTTLYGDIKQLDGKEWRGKIDILTGGFPCQPFSAAGHKRGKDDERFLWPEMLRVIREVEPTWVVGENVYGILTDKMATIFEGICTDMEKLGYEIQPIVIPASSVEAPHQRNRVWFVANSNCIKREKRLIQSRINTEKSGTTFEEFRDLQFMSGRDYTFTFRGKDKSFFCGEDDGIPNRVDRIKALGNAIVPQVAYEIFKAIESSDKM